MKERARNIFLLGLIYGAFLLFIRFIFQLTQEELWNFFFITSAIIILGVMIISIILTEKLKSLQKILKEEGNPDKFIKENEKLQRLVKFKGTRACLNINICAGYCDKGEYETAKNILLSTKVEHIDNINKVIYYLDLTYIHFKLEEEEKALDILELHRKEFSSWENHVSTGGTIAVIRIYQLITQNQLFEARELLDFSKEKWTDRRLLKDWEVLNNKISELEKKAEL